jgi:hypothetical protein
MSQVSSVHEVCASRPLRLLESRGGLRTFLGVCVCTWGLEKSPLRRVPGLPFYRPREGPGIDEKG